LALWLWTSLAAVVLVLAWHRFGPWDANVRPFDSDDAIILLMANADRLSPFHLYYFGQDRYGGWPFLLAQLLHRLTGQWWSAESMHILLSAWRALGLLPLVALLPRFRLLLATTYLASLYLDPLVVASLARLGQPYSWQLVTLLIAWWLLRQGGTALGRARQRRALGFLAAAAGVSLLATWISTVSVPLLVLAAGGELARAVVTVGERTARQLTRLALALLSPVVFGFAGERVLHAWYTTTSLATFGTDFTTPTTLDLDRLGSNAGTLWAVAQQTPWWVTAPLASILAGSALVFLGQQAFALRTPSGRPPMDAAIGCLVLTGWGWAAFAVSAAATWVRLNRFDERYIVLSLIAWPLAVTFGLVLLLDRQRFTTLLLPRLGAVGLLILVLFAFPAPGGPNRYVGALEAAQHLAHQAPGAVLLGGYWGTYVFTALVPGAGLVPVVRQGEYDRTPWTRAALTQADRVLVSFWLTGPFGPPHGLQPPPVIVEQQQVLALDGPPEEVAGYRFAPYRNLSRISWPARVLPALDHLDLCDDEMDVTLLVAPTTALTLVIWTEVPAFARVPTLVVTLPEASAPSPPPRVRFLSSSEASLATIERPGQPFSALRLTVRPGGRLATSTQPNDLCPATQLVAAQGTLQFP
jgi:hypothetical protein